MHLSKLVFPWNQNKTDGFQIFPLDYRKSLAIVHMCIYIEVTNKNFLALAISAPYGYGISW